MNAVATRRLAGFGRMLLRGLAGPACQQPMQAHLPQPAVVIEAWMRASIEVQQGSSDATPSRVRTGRAAHAVHLQGAHA
ncbi:hypothetical protein [Leptothrix discophora]|uniref:Uncharacterized protein n=1 Tax=Leptothrix discophora TaxID=89 RepID=A0ABT9G4S5_LEPDI|nr:hypothetical protein [Leptothrix discophora]MDP4301406.1 hypothetical protein [Leptothrix discophora]